VAQTSSLSKRYSCWPALKKHRQYWNSVALQDLFARDSRRSHHYSLEAAGLRLDYSRNHLNDSTLALFATLWRQARVGKAIEQLLAGDNVNSTERRAAWHTALRDPHPPAEVAATLERMGKLVAALHRGEWRGYSGQSITDVVNIGIGGSDLGPRMVTQALSSFHLPTLRCHFVANIDPQDLTATLATLKPETTLFIVASKSFSTLETLANATLAREWFLCAGKTADIARHFVAVSTAVDKARAFGIAEQNIFPLWDWVGGRYSLWSAIGLPIAIACGMEHFNALLHGAHTMDRHFRASPVLENMPGLLALLEIWYSQFFAAQTHAILPYSHGLKEFPNFLQQLEMESNGKSVDRQGRDITYASGSILWGSAGSMGQHSFHQLLHQGTAFVPVDFILPLTYTVKSDPLVEAQHRHLVANCLAQSEALLYGQDLVQVKAQLRKAGLSTAEANKLAPHKVIPGNRPHNIISMDVLTPETLGALIALYEHKVYVQSVILNINAFDQWGVELGKQLSQPLYEALSGVTDEPVDDAVQNLVQRYRDLHS
jgi:glucose-6-phosphate isomerase